MSSVKTQGKKSGLSVPNLLARISPVLLFFTLLAAATPGSGTKVIVLGIAQDGGIPQIGCEQKICRTQKHHISSLAIVQNQSVYLIDATPDLRNQYAELIHRNPTLRKGTLLDGIFLTHAHMGHYSGLLYLGKESISTRQTPVYCSPQMATFLKNNAPWNLLVENGNVALKIFDRDRSVDLGFKITPLEVPHRKEFTDTYGFRIEGEQKSLLYIPDIDAWKPVQPKISEWLARSDYALLDGTFYSGNELPGRDMKKVPHPTIQDSISFFKTLPQFGAKIFFTHLNHTNPILEPGSAEHQQVKKSGYDVAVDWQEFHL